MQSGGIDKPLTPEGDASRWASSSSDWKPNPAVCGRSNGWRASSATCTAPTVVTPGALPREPNRPDPREPTARVQWLEIVVASPLVGGAW